MCTQVRKEETRLGHLPEGTGVRPGGLSTVREPTKQNTRGRMGRAGIERVLELGGWGLHFLMMTRLLMEPGGDYLWQ